MPDSQRIDGLPSLPPRARDGHKGDYGRVLIVGGSLGMAGAVGLAGMAALRGGAGLVYVVCPEDILATVAGYEPSYLTIPLPHRPSHASGNPASSGPSDGKENQERSEPGESWSQIVLSQPADVIAIGPGMGRSTALARLVRRVLMEATAPVLVDADGLNLLAANLDVLKQRKGPTILTPHPGEFARLSGLSLPRIAADRVGLAIAFAREHNVVLVLKGAGTVIADSTRHAVNQTGNPGMATGGAGDVLTGLAAALLAQGLSAWEAARLAVHLHGLAGDVAAGRKTEVSLIARDIVEAIPDAFAHYHSPVATGASSIPTPL